MVKKGKKGVSELGGLREIRTMGSSKKKSIPRVQSSPYLDLYMLRKEKDRLEKEAYVLDKRKKSVQKRINDIDAEMVKLEELEEARKSERKGCVHKKPPVREWNTMSMKY